MAQMHGVDTKRSLIHFSSCCVAQWLLLPLTHLAHCSREGKFSNPTCLQAPASALPGQPSFCRIKRHLERSPGMVRCK